MCFDLFLKLFRKQPISDAPPQPLRIPYPEEPPDYSQTVENINREAVILQWLKSYDVPLEWWDYWKSAITINVTTLISVPAQTWGNAGQRHLDVRPEWLNPGVICHENCHSSYSLLSEEEKKAFTVAYTPLKTIDPMIVFLYSRNTYGLNSDIEGHAELGRYLGQFMPKELLKFYPRLFADAILKLVK